MLDVFTTSTYEEIRRATVDGDVDFDVFDRQLFQDIQNQLIDRDNTDAAHNVLYTGFELCADSADITNALMSLMKNRSLDSAQAAVDMMQEAIDEMTRAEITKIARSI